MRILVTFNKGMSPPLFADSFKKYGLVADMLADGYEDADDVRGYLDLSDPYSILMHGDDLRGEVFDDVLSRAPVYSRFFNRASRQGRFDPVVIVRNAFIKLSLVRGGSKEGVITAGAFEVNLLEGTAKVDGKPLGLSSQEFFVMRALFVYGADNFVRPKDLYSHVYGVDGDSDDGANLVNVHINKINKKIINSGSSSHIIKAYGKRGYTLGDHTHDLKPLVGGISFSSQSGVFEKDGKRVKVSPQAALIMDSIIEGGGVLNKANICSKLDISIQNLHVYMTHIKNAMRGVSGYHYIGTNLGEGFYLSKTPVPESGTRLAMQAKATLSAAPT